MMHRFSSPFLAGIFLEHELRTSSRYFQFLFRMFAYGDAAVPENGMEMLPRQLAVRLKSGTVRTNARVRALRRNTKGFALDVVNEESCTAREIVVAVDDRQACFLLDSQKGRNRPLKDQVRWNRTTTF